MVFDARRVRLFLLVVLAPAFVACTVAEAGSATTGSGSESSPSVSASVSASATASATATATGADRSVAITPGEWTSADVRRGPDGIPSPTGDLVAVPAGNQICFRSVNGGGSGACGSLAGGDRPVYAVYGPDGAELLMVAGPDAATESSIYLLNTADGAVRVIGPDRIGAATGVTPPRWNLSTVAWAADGTSVVIVPHTDGATGPVLSADLNSGSVVETGTVAADLANSAPSIWPTRNGTAWVANSGGDRQALWWQDDAAAPPTQIATFAADGGSLFLGAADPLGRVVLTCPRSAEGRLGASVYVGVENRKSGPLLSDSPSCAGAVFSADSRYVALAATLPTGYSLIVIEVSTNRRALTVPLPVAEPGQPPYLTWLNDVVVISDVSGDWAAPSLIVRLQ